MLDPGVTGFGLNVLFSPAGRPDVLIVIGVLNPAIGVVCMVYVAVEPLQTLTDAGVAAITKPPIGAEMVKSVLEIS